MDKAEYQGSTWTEYRVSGRCPDRRAYHASFKRTLCSQLEGLASWKLALGTKAGFDSG